MSAPESPLMRQRERARRLATQVVALALGLAGLMLLALAIVLAFQGRAGLFLLATVVGIAGIALAGIGFFFQLVPMRVDELAAQKREHDARERRL